MEKTPEAVMDILDRETQKMALKARQYGIYFFVISMLPDEVTKEVDIAKSINMTPTMWTRMVSDVLDDFPGLRQATLLALGIEEMDVQQ